MARIPKKAEHVAWRLFGDRAVILDLDRDRAFHQMNDVGTAVWSRADGTRTVDEITAMICHDFDVDAEQARTDTEQFLTELSEKGLIEWSPN